MHLNRLLTIVIPCKNEGMIIEKTLRLLNEQYQAEDLKVIIADSSDDAYTGHIIRGFIDKNIKVTVVEGGLPAIARNRGAELVTTKYVLFLDADIFLEGPYMLHNILIDTYLNDYYLTTCRITTKDAYSVVYTVFEWIRSLVVRKTPFALGGFMLFNRAAFNKLGGFAEEDKIAEDYHLSKNVDPEKFKIYPYTAYTTSRRFQKKGIFYMVKIMLTCWFNRNNEDFYKRDYKYFQ